MRHAPVNSSRRTPRGSVLVIVLVVVVVLSLAAYQFGELMTAEYRATDGSNRLAQARGFANSGISFAAAVLSSPDALSGTLNGNPFDNAAVFQDVIVSANNNPHLQGRFSLVCAIDPQDPAYGSQPCRYGMIDECGKINLNALLLIDSSGQVAHNMLMTLPNMTEDIANSILDWIDPDDDARSSGAESDYYSTLSTPYNAKNGPLDTVEELLLVKGVTPQLLFGNDQNRNGVLDANEDDGTGVVDPGWSAYLTVYSRELNLNSQGTQRIYVNQKDLPTLYQTLQTAVGSDLANYILAYRLYGSSPAGGRGSSASDGLPGTALAKLQRDIANTQQQGRAKSLASLFEIINTTVSIPNDNPMLPPTPFPCPLNNTGVLKDSLPTLLDQVSTVNGMVIPARINVNTAPQTVLNALSGLTPSDVQNILNHRPAFSSTDAPDPIFQTLTWLITEANLAPKTLQSLDKYITASSGVYRIQALGYFDKGGPTARVEAVIDTNNGRPRIVYWRDLAGLGKGFNVGTGN